jgi:hypothetical protein
MSRSYISSAPCASIAVLWKCFNFLYYCISAPKSANVSLIRSFSTYMLTKNVRISGDNSHSSFTRASTSLIYKKRLINIVSLQLPCSVYRIIFKCLLARIQVAFSGTVQPLYWDVTYLFSIHHSITDLVNNSWLLNILFYSRCCSLCLYCAKHCILEWNQKLSI